MKARKVKNYWKRFCKDRKFIRGIVSSMWDAMRSPLQEELDKRGLIVYKDSE